MFCMGKGGVHMYHVHIWRSEDNLGLFSPSHMCILGIELRPSGLVASAFAHWLILPSWHTVVKPWTWCVTHPLSNDLQLNLKFKFLTFLLKVFYILALGSLSVSSCTLTQLHTHGLPFCPNVYNGWFRPWSCLTSLTLTATNGCLFL